jgi:hypothetical protein
LTICIHKRYHPSEYPRIIKFFKKPTSGIKMNQPFRLQVHANHVLTIMSILSLMVTAVLPALISARANAAQITSRKITMSDSKWSATGVTYSAAFNVSSTWSGNLDGIVVEFCSGANTPIIGDTTCAIPTGFAAAATSANFKVNGVAVGGVYTAATLNTNRTFILSYASGAHAAPTASQSVSFDMTGITNPSLGNSTFYARVYTYNAAAGATGYTLANPNAGATYVDAGGVAISTSNDLVFTSKVQERLQFCITTSATCATAGTEKDTTAGNRTVAINVGDANGVLDTAGAYVNSNVKMYVQTNASGNAVVVVKGDTLCNPMQTYPAASTCSVAGKIPIAAIGSTAATNAFGTEQFGFCVRTAAGATVSVPYGDGVANQDTTEQCASAPNNSGGASSTVVLTKYGFDAASAISASGSTVLTKTPGVTTSHVISFIGNIAPTSKAGIYGTALQFIATGTY